MVKNTGQRRDGYCHEAARQFVQTKTMETATQHSFNCTCLGMDSQCNRHGG